MRIARAALGLVALGAAAAGVALTEGCRDPTEIVVDVRTDACDSVKNTMIVVGDHDGIETAQPTIFSRGNGCEIADRIGTLTIVPRDAKDAEVSIKVVTGVDKPAHECAATTDGCIVARRRARFAPGRSQTIIVIMSLACTGKDCGPNAECAPSGLCVDPGSVDPDGGIEPGPADAGPDGAPAGDGGPGDDAGPVGGCNPATCQGPGRACENNVCTIRCQPGTPCTGDVCPGDQDCSVLCGGGAAGACNAFECTTKGSCSILCDVDDACGTVRCNAASCAINCNKKRACADLRVDAGSSTVTCRDYGSMNDFTCDEVRCAGGSCTLTCAGNGCAGKHGCCAASCSGPWDDAGPTACN